MNDEIDGNETADGCCETSWFEDSILQMLLSFSPVSVVVSFHLCSHPLE